MTKEAKLTVLEYATRQSANTLTELLNIYGSVLTSDQRVILKDVTIKLWDLETSLRKTTSE